MQLETASRDGDNNHSLVRLRVCIENSPPEDMHHISTATYIIRLYEFKISSFWMFLEDSYRDRVFRSLNR